MSSIHEESSSMVAEERVSRCDLNASSIPDQKPAAPQSATPAPEPPQSVYRLRIKLNPRGMANGVDPLCLLSVLHSMGECAISAQTDQIPWLEEMDPEECYFYWDAIINTRASLADLEAIFFFVQDDASPAGKSQISITRLNDELEDETGEPLAIEQKKIGEILVERGDITREQVCQVLARQKRSGDLMVEAGIVSRGKVESALIEQKMVRQLRTPTPLATPAPLAGNQVNTAVPLAAKTSGINADTIGVSIKKLDRLINLAGEMGIIQAQLSKACASYQDPDILTQVESIGQLTNELCDCALNIRMLPIETTFGKFRRLVQDLSASLGKQVELVTFGGEIELDKTVIERIYDPLVHLIRNSLDHGIESPDERLKEGKPAIGTIRLSAEQSGEEVIITVEDDGAGLDREIIWAKGVERGLIPEGRNPYRSSNAKDSESDAMTDSRIFNLIFLPGFSTASKVSDVSGQGAGMDVVRWEISKLRGSVDIESQKGQGTKTSIHLPLTLAII